MDLKELRQRIADGDDFEYEFFWRGPFSQWAKQGFTVDGIHYKTAEHWMMAEKARMFKDYKACDNIIKSVQPYEAKALGRKIRNFNEEKWVNERYGVVYAGNEHKFTQNEEYKELLLSTGNKIMVEASPADKIWGIGLDETNPLSLKPLKWRGLNLLGFILTDLKNNLREHRTP